MLRLSCAPCSPFTVTKDLMSKTADLAREFKEVRLHTHLAENDVSTAFLALPIVVFGPPN